MAQLTKSLSIVQWLEHPTSFWEVVGLNPVGDLDFFLCPTLVTNEHFIFIKTDVAMILCKTYSHFK